MNSQAGPITDAIAFIHQLDADAIRKQIDALEHERQALLVLLRAADRVRREAKKAESELEHDQQRTQ